MELQTKEHAPVGKDRKFYMDTVISMEMGRGKPTPKQEPCLWCSRHCFPDSAGSEQLTWASEHILCLYAFLTVSLSPQVAEPGIICSPYSEAK